MKAFEGLKFSRHSRHSNLDGDEYDMTGLREDASVVHPQHTVWVEGESHQDGPADRSDFDKPTEDFMWYTPDEEKHVVRTFDRRLVLFVAFLYLLSFLDRSSMLCSPSRLQGIQA